MYRQGDCNEHNIDRLVFESLVYIYYMKNTWIEVTGFKIKPTIESNGKWLIDTFDTGTKDNMGYKKIWYITSIIVLLYCLII